MDTTTLKRFEKWVIPEPNSGCWLWEGTLVTGYGQLSVGKNGVHKKMYAHRLSYEHYKEESIEGWHVLHRCDNPACVNPEHLYLGTHSDNMRDKADKGRAHGFSREFHPMTKLSEELCTELQSKYSGKYGEIVKLAEEYGVSRNTISAALRFAGGGDYTNWKKHPT